jgi:hypothetical protein
LNMTHQLWIYAVDVTLLGDSINTIKENTETLLEAIRDIGLEINAEKTKYEGVSRSFRAGRLERELQMVQPSATRCSRNAIL